MDGPALVVGAVVLRTTTFGYHVYATGGNAAAARASGIDTRRIKLLCFVLTGSGGLHRRAANRLAADGAAHYGPASNSTSSAPW